MAVGAYLQMKLIGAFFAYINGIRLKTLALMRVTHSVRDKKYNQTAFFAASAMDEACADSGRP